MSFYTEKSVRFDAFTSRDKQRVILTISTSPMDTMVSFSLDEAHKLIDLINDAADECEDDSNPNQENFAFMQNQEAV